MIELQLFKVRWTRTMVVTLVGMVAAALVFTWCAWQRRWISDDGLIYVRVVRNILHGNGPVFNAFERTEANTSALWPWLLAVVGGLKGGDIAPTAVVTGMLFTIAGFVLAMDGTRRWQRARGSTAILVPGGALVVLAVFPFWDYASSGLETGLTTLWLGTLWWTFVQLERTSSRRRQVIAAIVFGLGPLVRPDLGLASGVFMLAGWLLLRPTRRRSVLLVAVALVLPVGYEIFRAGYYGVLVPLPALAKSATHAEWHRGWLYLVDFVKPYMLWVPLGILVGLFGFVVARRGVLRARGRDRIIFATPVITAALMGIYVLRVGADFMHGRMLLPVTLVLLLPGILLPVRRVSAVPLALLAGWALIIGLRVTSLHGNSESPFVGDERAGYCWWTHHPNPVHSRTYVNAARPVSTALLDAVRAHRPVFMTEGGVSYPPHPQLPVPAVFAVGRLGMGGAVAPLDGVAADTLGLANPIGARITMTRPGEGPGHQKMLPYQWLFAEFADPASDRSTGASPLSVQAARNALECGELAELVASVREPMTAGRFWDNLVGSVRRTRLVIPSDPVDAEEKFCGSTTVPKLLASSSCERFGWSKDFAIDGVKTVVIGRPLGFSTEVWNEVDHPEWFELQLRATQPISSIVIYPRDDAGFLGAGFPIDFTIQVWDGTRWIDRITKTDYPRPAERQVFVLDPPATTDRIRIAASKLQDVPGDGYVMQFAEIEVTR